MGLTALLFLFAGSMVSYLRLKTALLNEFDKKDVDANKGMVQECIMMTYQEEVGPLHSQPSTITGQVGKVDSALHRKDYSVLPNDLVIRIPQHSHSLRIVPPNSERGVRQWTCKLCSAHEQQRVTFRFRCCMTCEWSVCDVCASTLLGSRKVVSLQRTPGVPVGIQFSGTVVTAVVKESPAAECGQIFTSDIVVSVNKTKVQTLASLSALLQASRGNIILELAEPFPARSRERTQKIISTGKEAASVDPTGFAALPFASHQLEKNQGVPVEEDRFPLAGTQTSVTSAPLTAPPIPSAASLDRLFAESLAVSPVSSGLVDTSTTDAAALRVALYQMEQRYGQLVHGVQRMQHGLDSSTELLALCENKRAQSEADAKRAIAAMNASESNAANAEQRTRNAESRAHAAELALLAAKETEQSLLLKCAFVGKQNHLQELELAKQAAIIADLQAALEA